MFSLHGVTTENGSQSAYSPSRICRVNFPLRDVHSCGDWVIYIPKSILVIATLSSRSRWKSLFQCVNVRKKDFQQLIPSSPTLVMVILLMYTARWRQYIMLIEERAFNMLGFNPDSHFTVVDWECRNNVDVTHTMISAHVACEVTKHWVIGIVMSHVGACIKE